MTHTININGLVDDGGIEVWCSCGTVVSVKASLTLEELNRLADEHVCNPPKEALHA